MAGCTRRARSLGYVRIFGRRHFVARHFWQSRLYTDELFAGAATGIGFRRVGCHLLRLIFRCRSRGVAQRRRNRGTKANVRSDSGFAYAGPADVGLVARAFYAQTGTLGDGRSAGLGSDDSGCDSSHNIQRPILEAVDQRGECCRSNHRAKLRSWPGQPEACEFG